MPKLKTNRAAAKRFRKTAKGFKRYHSRRRHNLGDKPRKQKRHLRSGGTSLVHETDVGRVVQLLPNCQASRRRKRAALRLEGRSAPSCECCSRRSRRPNSR